MFSCVFVGNSLYQDYCVLVQYEKTHISHTHKPVCLLYLEWNSLKFIHDWYKEKCHRHKSAFSFLKQQTNEKGFLICLPFLRLVFNLKET